MTHRRIPAIDNDGPEPMHPREQAELERMGPAIEAMSCSMPRLLVNGTAGGWRHFGAWFLAGAVFLHAGATAAWKASAMSR
jgi:hypothetical protein